MKNTVVIITLALMSSCSFGQKKAGTPESVKTAFSSKFPNAQKVKWEKEEGNYEAAFVTGGKEQSAVFDTNGKLLETEVEIKSSELPVNVLTYVSTKYPNAKIKEAAQIVLADGSKIYEAEVKGIDLLFDSNGKFIESKKD